MITLARGPIRHGSAAKVCSTFCSLELVVSDSGEVMKSELGDYAAVET